MIYLLIAIKAFQVLLGPIYDYLDGRLLGHSLRRSEKRRLEIRDEKLAKGEEFRGWTVHKPTSWFFGLQYAGMVVVSWVVSPPLPTWFSPSSLSSHSGTRASLYPPSFPPFPTDQDGYSQRWRLTI